MDSVVVGAPAAYHPHRLNSAAIDLDNIASSLQRRRQQQQPPIHYATLPHPQQHQPRYSNTLAQCPGAPPKTKPLSMKTDENGPRWPKSGSSSGASLSLTFANRRHHQQNQHNWWKVCWLYGGGGNGGHHLLEQRQQGNISHFNYHRSSKPTQVPTTATSVASVASLHRSPSDVPKQQQQPTSSSSSISSFSAAVAATLPSHFRLRRRRQQRRDGAK